MKLYTLILMMLLAGSSFAQLVLGPDRLISAGDKVTMISMDTTGVVEGAKGANQTWNFNNISAGDTLYMEYVNASSSPYAANFPSATIASIVNDGENPSYSYISNSGNQILSYGNSSAEVLNVYDSPSIVASFPFTYNSSFNSGYSSSYDMGDGLISKQSGVSAHSGDAYGTIILPDGSTHNTLRVKVESITVDSLFMGEMFFGTSVLTSTSYSFYISGSKYAVFSVNYIKSEFLGNVFNSKTISYTPALTTGIDDDKNTMPVEFALKQNHPNPFNPSTRISFSLNEKSFISLKVYNLAGEEVATIAQGEREAGEYSINFDASRLSAGIYFYQLSAGRMKETRKMVLLK